MPNTLYIVKLPGHGVILRTMVRSNALRAVESNDNARLLVRPLANAEL